MRRRASRHGADYNQRTVRIGDLDKKHIRESADCSRSVPDLLANTGPGKIALHNARDVAQETSLATARSTTILPTFCPWKRPMKALTASLIPFTTVSLFFSLPVRK